MFAGIPWKKWKRIDLSSDEQPPCRVQEHIPAQWPEHGDWHACPIEQRSAGVSRALEVAGRSTRGGRQFSWPCASTGQRSMSSPSEFAMISSSKLLTIGQT